jgi:hypothetical protein
MDEVGRFVTRGTHLLDGADPGWPERINVELYSRTTCRPPLPTSSIARALGPARLHIAAVSA